MSRTEAIVANLERRVDREATAITSAIEWWLSEEVISSGQTHDAYLDDFQHFDDALHHTSEAARNNQAAKAKSHYERLIMWSENVANEDYDLSDADMDYMLARQLFGVMMLLSGNLRTQALIAASSQEEYAELRSNSSHIGLDMHQAIKDRLWWHRAVKEFESPEKEKSNLIQNTLVVNEAAYQWSGGFLYDRSSFESGRKDTETLAAGHVAEQAWLELAVDYICYMDDRNFSLGRSSGYEGFAGVPFLEPKSITLEPGVIYPLSAGGP